MAQWVSHCIVADRVLARLPWLDRHAFCVGSIAPDCNLPNEDWSSFTPSREITHRMRGSRKSAEDCAAFCRDYILDRIGEILSRAETPPFEVLSAPDVRDDVKLKYRYLHLRHPDLQRNILFRHKLAKAARLR